MSISTNRSDGKFTPSGVMFSSSIEPCVSDQTPLTDPLTGRQIDNVVDTHRDYLAHRSVTDSSPEPVTPGILDQSMLLSSRSLDVLQEQDDRSPRIHVSRVFSTDCTGIFA
jgi:hypothetical protein